MEPAKQLLRKTPRQARSRSTVEAILSAADRVLRTEGYAAASTNRVARVAGFSVGSLYQYFDDRQAVVGTLLDRALREEAAQIASALDEMTHRPLETGAACERVLRVVLGERRRRAHLLRTLDVFGEELHAAPASRHLLHVEGRLLADAVQRFAAAHFGAALRGRFDAAVAVAARFVHALSYGLVVDAAGSADDEATLRHAARALDAALTRSLAPAAGVGRLLGGAERARVPAFADAAGRARRTREVRSALIATGGIPSNALESAVHLVAALAEVNAELRQGLVQGVEQDVAGGFLRTLLQACLDAVTA